jgi:hypothetical protein
MLELDLTFPHTYEVEEVREFPGTGKFSVPLHYFPPPKSRPEHNGLWLKLKASDTAWIGVFAFGISSDVSRVVSTPDSKRICVISKGGAYLVKADQPDIWEQIPVMPVVDVRPIPEQKLLVLSDFIRLAACGSGGLVWRSPRVCWDGLKIVNVTHDTIEGTGYDPTNSITHELRFVVDLKTGRSLLPSPVSVDGKPIW